LQLPIYKVSFLALGEQKSNPNDDDTGVTEEERQVFVNGMETAKTDDIQRGSDEEYHDFVLIKFDP
jgi:hypothetical protein